jgi:hypothetical protein
MSSGVETTMNTRDLSDRRGDYPKAMKIMDKVKARPIDFGC